ncbi:MAG: hypothetical protein IPI15_16575 [Saprospiraceae bacterium]|uniref:hypothetical protein n=1 Tax=Candidatus Brachybacter algidus TaxID=2982024 RepID=UPI00257B92B6|nr:hypothetical protein [Candidatus Brachybacter algidus]MBK7605157.1 hypothetical protein [Candidatus Brachybacter algidus]
MLADEQIVLPAKVQVRSSRSNGERQVTIGEETSCFQEPFPCHGTVNPIDQVILSTAMGSTVGSIYAKGDHRLSN